MAPKSLSRRAGAFITAQFAATIIGAATGMVLSRLFTKQEMGSYQQLMFTYTFLSSILLLGLPSSLTYFYPTCEDKYKPTTVYVVMGGLFVLGGVIGVSTFLAAPLVSRYFKNDALVPLLHRFFLFYAFTLGSAYMRRFLVATNRYRFMMFWLPFDRLANLAAFAVPAFMGYELASIVEVAVWVTGIKFAVALVYTLHVVPPQTFLWSRDLATRIFLYSLPLGLSAAAGQISRQIDRLVIGHYMPTEFFAIYSWGAQRIPFVGVIAASVMTVLIPELARLYKDGNRAQFTFIWHEAIRKTAIIVLGVLGFIEFFATSYIVALYSDKYLESVVYFRMYQVLLIYRVTLFGYVLQALGRPRVILYITLVGVCLKAVVSILFFKMFGPLGPPAATLLTVTCSFFLYLRIIGGSLNLGPKRVWPWSYYIRILISAVTAGLAASAVYLIPQGVIAGAVAWMSRVGAWGAGLIGQGAVSGWLKGFFEGLSGSASLAALGRLVVGACAFVPVYVLLLCLLKTVKPKDWALLKEVTIGRFRRKQAAP
ncbi:MAG: oligosaccharide flippase family protein [Planctomycetes bacterium]|nr:oligosaccharide flippase family protein [Planctomycetota bacterium]